MASTRKRLAVADEGPEAATRFEGALGKILTVSKEELARREAAYQQERSTKDRPGPRRAHSKSDK